MSETSSPFRVLARAEKRPPRTGGNLREQVSDLVSSSPVFLFMKGNPQAPRCGYSANIVGILSMLGVEFASFDVLSDPRIRSFAKEYARWPTFPQLWVRGELVGGNDIVSEMYRAGELQELLAGATS